MSTAADRFRRLLLLLPRFAEQSIQRLDDLAAQLGVDRATVVEDLQSLPARYDLAGFTERVCVCVDGDEAIVNTDHFLRPMRLSAAEFHALELGLSVMLRELGVTEREALVALRDRVAGIIAALPRDNAYAGIRDGGLGAHADGVMPVLRRGLRRGRVVELRYQGSGDGAAATRRVRPCALAHGLGRWYLVAWCERSDGMRNFRVDRIAEATLLDAPCAVPEGFDLDALLLDGVPWVTSAEVPTCRVRYSPAIARWIAERHGTPLEPDGSVIRTMPLADREWLLRHVLQYGPDARILEPPELRAELVERLGGS